MAPDDRFLNSYHFVPRKKRLEGEGEWRKAPLDPSGFGLSEATRPDGHAVYAKGTYSGQVTCIVTLECPTVIGGRRLSGRGQRRYSIVEPFVFDGHPAIPATSLKGVISSVAESVTQSPYRVLENMRLTVAFNRNTTRLESSADGPMRFSHAYFDGQTPLDLSRSSISPVEAMFGYVRASSASGDTRVDTKGRLMAVAGKLRFSHALLTDEWRKKAESEIYEKGDWSPPSGVRSTVSKQMVRLKEQAQPMKTPKGKAPDLRSATPNFYFLRNGDFDSYISKQAFGTSDSSLFSPQGGKFYLHHVDANTGVPWKTSVEPDKDVDAERKAAALPLKRGVQFRFSIGFDNLTPREIQILCFSLRPTAAFRHKIGLGKGLGLGSIRIDLERLVLVDRRARYLPESLFGEDQRHVHSTAGANDVSMFEGFRATFADWVRKNDRRALEALLAIGERHNFDGNGVIHRTTPVIWVPLNTDKLQKWKTGERDGLESDTYEWFFTNDDQSKGDHQKLQPIRQGVIPPLRATKPKPPKNKAPKK